MHRSHFALATLLTAFSLGAPASAAPPTPASSVKLELADAKAGTTQSSTLVVPLDGHGVARVETRSDAGQTVIKIFPDGPRGRNALRFDIERTRLEGGRHNGIHVEATLRLVKGKPAVIADLTRPDGSSTRVTAELR